MAIKFKDLSEEQRKKLAGDYARKIVKATEGEGALGFMGIGTNEGVIQNISKDLQRMGSSDMVDLISEEVGKLSNGYSGLRDLLLSEYSGDDEDAVMNAFGYPTDDFFGSSAQEYETDDPNKSNYAKFGFDGSVQTDEHGSGEKADYSVSDPGTGDTVVDPEASTDYRPKDGQEEPTSKPTSIPIPPTNQPTSQPSLDNPAPGSAADVRRSYQNMPDYVSVPGTNTKQPNRAKQMLQTEEKRLLRDEINARIKADKESARKAMEYKRLDAVNDQYRDIFSKSSNDRSAEDWDMLDRDQKIKLIKNYNENTRRAKENAKTKKASGVIGGAYEVPNTTLQDLEVDQVRDFTQNSLISPEVKTQATQIYDDLAAPYRSPMTELETLNTSPLDDAAKQAALPPGLQKNYRPSNPSINPNITANSIAEPSSNEFLNAPIFPSLSMPESSIPETRTSPVVSPESYEIETPSINSYDNYLPGIQSTVDASMPQARRNYRNRPKEIPEGAVHRNHPNVPEDAQSGIHATNPAVKQRGVDARDAYLNALSPGGNQGFTPHYPDADSKSTRATLPPGLPPQKSLQSLLDDPTYQQNVAKRNPLKKVTPQKSLQSLLDDSTYQQNVAKRNPGSQIPAPTAKLPSADPFNDEETAEMQGPSERMVPIYGSSGIVGYRSYSDQRKAAQDYAKTSMKNSSRSLLGDTYSDDMSRLYPTLNTGGIKREIDQENIARFSKNNPFGEEYRPKGKRYNPFA